MLIINTIKNTLSRSKDDETTENKQKSKKKVQWTDTLARNSINAGKRLFLNAKISNNLKKTAIPNNIPGICVTFSQKSLLK